MTKDKGMRIKDVGATINLGNYSTLHVTIGESAEYEGLELQRATSYLRNIAKTVGGILNLPDEMVDGKKAKNIKSLATPIGKEYTAFGTDTKVLYEHVSHTYTLEDGTPLTSVTQFLGKYYPKNVNIKQEYMDYAANFGSLVHTAIQNAVIGKPPKKELTKQVVDDAMDEIGQFDESWVERFIVDTEHHIGGRFDILTKADGKNTLWDVKTNSDMFIAVEDCSLPQEVKDYLKPYWGTDTIYGEHCLQLNMYAYMLEKSGTKVDAIKILHTPDKFEKVYPVPKIDMGKVLEMLV